MIKKLFNRFKSKLFVSFMPNDTSEFAPMMQRAIANNPELAESMLRSNEAIWTTAMQSFMVHRYNELHGEAGLPPQLTQQYPVLNRLGYGARHVIGRNLPKVSPYNLRQFSEYPPVRRAINAITGPILDMPWSIEVMQSPTETRKPSDLTLKEKAQIQIVTNVFKNPNYDDSWRTLLWQTLEDIIVGAFGSIEIQKTDNVFRPVVMYPVDGSSIRINSNWAGDPEEPRYSQNLQFVGPSASEHNTVDLRDDELLYFRLQPRTNTPFGLGYVETAYRNINAWVGAVEYAEKRASNSTPNYALFLGEHVDPATANVWRRYWENEVEGYGKIPIIGGGRQPEVLKFAQGGEDELWLKWQELLIRYVAQAFNLSASTFALERDVNRSTAGQMDADDWGAVSPIAYTVSDLLTNKFIHRILGFENLRFKWVIRDTDEKRQSEILTERYEMDSITPNEIREHYDQDPLEDEVGNMVRTQLRAIEDALPAIAPGLRDRGMNDNGSGDKPNGDNSGYILDRINRLVKKRI